MERSEPSLPAAAPDRDVDGVEVRVAASFGVAGGHENGQDLVDQANLAKKRAKMNGKNCVALSRNNEVTLCAPSELYLTDVPASELATDASASSSEAVLRWRALLVEAKATKQPVELDSEHKIQLEQRDSGGNVLRVDALLDGWIAVEEVGDSTFDLACSLRGVQGLRMARIPLSQLEDVWHGAGGRLHVLLRRALVWLGDSARLI